MTQLTALTTSRGGDGDVYARWVAWAEETQWRDRFTIHPLWVIGLLPQIVAAAPEATIFHVSSSEPHS